MGMDRASGKIRRMSELWFIRHGETDWNREGLYQGQADIPLNELGLEQACAAAEKLAQAGRAFSAIYSSPLRRARQTAEQAALRFHLPVREDARLQEINQGEWTGKNYRSIVAAFGDPLAIALTNSKADGARDTVHLRAPGGESVAEVASRLALAASDIAQAHPGQTVLVFSHGLASATLYCQAAGIPLEQVYSHIPENGGILVVRWGSD